ncbi:MAG: hypothetical protein WKF61_03500 [Luteimonas sp.]
MNLHSSQTLESSFPRRRESGAFKLLKAKSLDDSLRSPFGPLLRNVRFGLRPSQSRLRGNDEQKQTSPGPNFGNLHA